MGRGATMSRCACTALIGQKRPWTCATCGVTTRGKHYESNHRRRERQARAKVLAAQAELAELTRQQESPDVISRAAVVAVMSSTHDAIAVRARWATAVQR